MSKSELLKFSGWAFILGGFSFATILSGSDPIALAGSVISSILLAVGILGLRARYGEYMGSFGRNILLIGVIGMVLLYMVVGYLFLMYFGVLPAIPIELPESLWILLFGGPAVLLLVLTLFGLSALQSKPIPRLNWLPVFAGIWYPVFYFFLAGYLFAHNGVYPGQYQIAFNIIHLIQFLALCVFGASLVTDAPQEMAAA